tara:strand:- start:758 stop:1252 length:495 start_codon:yes stop_codon:yes gene_type:complete
MKKIYYLIILLLFVIFSTGCAGYKPIFGSKNLDFKILEYSLEGDKKIGNIVYSKLYNLSKSNDDIKNLKSLKLLIDSSKNKESTSKDSAGKILEYRIAVTIKVKIIDSLTENQILNQTFTSSTTYKVQDQYSDTIKLEKKSIENLILKIYQDLLIRLSEKIVLL